MNVKIEYGLSSWKQVPKLADWLVLKWLVLKNGSANLIDPSAVGSTQ